MCVQGLTWLCYFLQRWVIAFIFIDYSPLTSSVFSYLYVVLPKMVRRFAAIFEVFRQFQKNVFNCFFVCSINKNSVRANYEDQTSQNSILSILQRCRTARRRRAKKCVCFFRKRISEGGSPPQASEKMVSTNRSYSGGSAYIRGYHSRILGARRIRQDFGKKFIPPQILSFEPFIILCWKGVSARV